MTPYPTGEGKRVDLDSFIILSSPAGEEKKKQTENNKQVLENITIYAGFIAGANTNNAKINQCNNKAVSDIDLNSGAGEYTLIVINSDDINSKNCKNYIGNMCGYSQTINNVTEGESKSGNIYSKALNTILFTGKVSS